MAWFISAALGVLRIVSAALAGLVGAGDPLVAGVLVETPALDLPAVALPDAVAALAGVPALAGVAPWVDGTAEVAPAVAPLPSDWPGGVVITVGTTGSPDVARAAAATAMRATAAVLPTVAPTPLPHAAIPVVTAMRIPSRRARRARRSRRDRAICAPVSLDIPLRSLGKKWPVRCSHPCGSYRLKAG
jgi:hypothetical protein